MNDRTHIVAILDASGSMASVGQAVKEEFNGYIEELKTDRQNEEPLISLVVFNNHVDNPYSKIPLSEVEPLTSEYRTHGMTACFDAIGETISKFDEDEHVILLIQTDGKENASRHYSRDQVKDLITEKTMNGWEIKFLGANIDAKTESAAIGIDPEHAFQYQHNKTGVKAAYNSMKDSTAVFRNDVSLKKGM